MSSLFEDAGNPNDGSSTSDWTASNSSGNTRMTSIEVPRRCLCGRFRINGKFVELEDGRSACMSKSVDKSSYSVLDLTVV